MVAIQPSQNGRHAANFQEPSFHRKVKHVFYKFSVDPFRTLVGWFKNIKIDNWNQRDANLSRMMPKVTNIGATLSNIIVRTCVGDFLKHHRSSIAFVSDNLEGFSLESTMSSIKEHKGKDMVFIPLVISGVRDHIVALVVDFKNNRIELYDPKGMTALDRAGEKLKDSDLELSTLIDRIAQEHGITDIYENTRKDQFDCNNCGVFVIEYFKERAEGKKADEITLIQGADPSYFAAIERMRLDIAQRIIASQTVKK